MGDKKKNMLSCYSTLSQENLNRLINDFQIPPMLDPSLPSPNTPVYPLPPNAFYLYTHHIKTANCRIPFSRFLMKVLNHYRIHISQCSPLGLAKVMHYEISCRSLDQVPDLHTFRYLFHITKAGDWYTFEQRRNVAHKCFTIAPSGLKGWKNEFLLLNDRCLPRNMVWRPNDAPPIKDPKPKPTTINLDLATRLNDMAHPIRPYPEHILVIGWISRIWPHTRRWPTISKENEGKRNVF